MPGDTLEIGGDKDADGKCDVDEDDDDDDDEEDDDGGYGTSDCNSAVGTSSAWTAIVVDRLKVTAGAKLTLNADYEATTVPVPEGIGPTSNQIHLAK